MTNRPTGHLITTILGLVFLLVGLGVLIVSPFDTLRLYWLSASWEQHPVTLEWVDLAVSHGDDATTYQVLARYRYDYHGQSYVGERVGYDQSKDNLGRYHQDTYRELQRRLTRGGATRAWVNPDDPQQSLLKRDLRIDKLAFTSLFGIVFAVIGGFVLRLGKAKPAPPLNAQGVELIECNQRQGFWLFAFMAFCFIGISSPGLFALPEELRDGNYAMLVILLFPLVGLWLVRQAWKARRNWRFYGPMPLLPDPSPGQLGGQVGGTITLQRHWPDTLPITATLQCLRTTRTGSGKNRSTRHTTLWQQSQPAYIESQGLATLISAQFAPPAELPASEPASDNYVHWQLTIEGAGMQGIPLDRNYDIPVVYGQQRASKSIPEVFLEQQQRQASVQALQDAAGQIDLQELENGLYLINRAGRNWGFHLTLLLTGLLMSGIALYLASIAAKEGAGLYFMAGVFLLFGIPLSLGGFYSIARSMVVVITDGQVSTRRYWLGIPLWQRYATLSSAGQLKLTNQGSYSSGTRTVELFHIDIEDAGRKLRLVENIRGRAAAESLRDSLVRLLRLDD